LPLKPGTDAVLFNGLLAQLAQSNSLDTSFIEQHTEGFDAALAQANAEQATFKRWRNSVNWRSRSTTVF